MDGTLGRSRRRPQHFGIAGGGLAAAWGWAGAAAAARAATGAVPPDSPPYQGGVAVPAALLLLLCLALLLLFRQLSGRRQAEAGLRLSEERFRLLVEESPVASYLIDRDGTIRYANRTLCAMFGYRQDDVIGRMNFGILIAPEDLPKVTEHFDHRLSGQSAPPRYEARGVHRNGERIDIEILGSAARSGEKSVAVGTLLDISQRKRVEGLMLQEQRQREEMNRTLEQRIREEVERSREKDRLMLQQSRFAAMGEMIGNIAHQWRQPLNKLGLVLQRLQMEQEKGVLTEQLMEERVESGMDQLLGLSRTIDDFRNFFRPELDPAPFSLAAAVTKTVSFFEASCAECDIKISFEGESRLVYTGHVVEFRQALLNILNNARDALLESRGPEPAIAVALRDEEHRTVLTVRDNAGGIKPEIIDKVFDPYFTTKGKGNRTGIGLYMAKAIIEQHMQGCILVSNLADGAEFRIVL